MLPALKPAALSLADVMESSLAAIRGETNRLALLPVDGAVVVLVDGLGADALKARSGHARTLAAGLSGASVIDSGFPTTTAAAIASLATGLPPGQHGLVGYSVLDSLHDRAVNQLSGWDDRLDPSTWQLAPTLFERASGLGLSATAIGPARYRDSGFTRAVLRGARYRDASSIDDRMALARETMGTRDSPGITYVYVPELDQAAHSHGWQSPEWTAALETTDAAIRELTSSLGPRQGMLVTADHGIIDVPSHSHVLFDTDPGLVDGIRFVVGEPRCLQLHFEPDANDSIRAGVLERWRESESDRSWVATRDEAIAAGWFGPVRAEVYPRIGDILVAARKSLAYYDSRAASQHGRDMIGQHGSWSPAEMRVPLVRFGAFAR
ncbi:alkaline phosphatase family protein [soil metagenome]